MEIIFPSIYVLMIIMSCFLWLSRVSLLSLKCISYHNLLPLWISLYKGFHRVWILGTLMKFETKLIINYDERLTRYCVIVHIVLLILGWRSASVVKSEYCHQYSRCYFLIYIYLQGTAHLTFFVGGGWLCLSADPENVFQISRQTKIILFLLRENQYLFSKSY